MKAGASSRRRERVDNAWERRDISEVEINVLIWGIRDVGSWGGIPDS